MLRMRSGQASTKSAERIRMKPARQTSSISAARSAASSFASNSALAGAMEDDIDLDCGSVLSGEVSIEEMGERIFERLVALASGEPSASERLGFGDLEFVPWQVGALL